MRQVLFLFAPILLIAGACQDQITASTMSNLTAQAQALEQEMADLTVVDEAEYQGLFVTQDPLTYAVRANYIRFQSGRVSEIMLIQIPAQRPTDQPFIIGRWREGILIGSELCELQNETPRCEPLLTADRFPIIRDGGEELLQHTYQSVAQALRQQFDSRQVTPSATSPPRVTQA